MPPLNPLEKLGWPVLAADRLNLFSGEARVLCALVMNPDQVMTPENLHSKLKLYSHAASFNVRKALPPRITLLRTALTDVGIDGQLIECVSESPVKPCLGYRINKRGADLVRKFVGA